MCLLGRPPGTTAEDRPGHTAPQAFVAYSLKSFRNEFKNNEIAHSS
jgi:hypothetical protein